MSATSSAPGARPRDTDPAVVAVQVGSAVVVGLALAWFFAGGLDLRSDATLILVAGPFAAALTVLAATRFEWFVWIVLLVRPSLDILSGGEGLGAGAVVSALFLVISTVWLLTQRRAGEWCQLSLAAKALLAFAFVVTLSVITSDMRVVSARAALEILAGISMLLVLEQLLPGRLDRVKRMVMAVMASAVVPVLVAFQQIMAGAGNDRVGVTRIYGTFNHPNPFATYLGLVMVLGTCVAFTVSGKRRVAAGAFVGLLGLVVVFTYNRAGWIALVIAAAYIGFRQSKWILAGLVGALVAVVLFVPSVSDRLSDLGDGDDRWLPEGVPRNSLEWRFQYWERILPMANDSPLTGIGPQVVLNARPEQLEPHNVFVQSYVETGVLGLLAFVGVLIGVAVTLVRRRRSVVTRLERNFSVGATAAALAMFSQMPSENLLNATMTWWYFAACATWGFHARRTGVDGSTNGHAAAGHDVEETAAWSPSVADSSTS